MSSENIEVRRLPKKTIYIIAVLVVLGILASLTISLSQQAKMSETLKTVGFPNVKSITIYNTSPVEDEQTKIRGELTKLKFKDLNTGKECFGFVLKNKKTGEYTKDLDCK